MRILWRAIKWAFFTLVALILLYVLPQHDVARVTGTEVIRQDFSSFNRLFYAQADSGANELATRDVRFIQTVKQKSFLFGFIPRDSYGVMVYRNEDSGWIWPPYFKFDSADLQGEAQSFESTQADPRWVLITHYGWRNRFFSIYPNAIGIKPIDGPDHYSIPWFNIGFFIFIGVALLFVRAMWRQFRERSLDPTLDAAEDRWDRVEAAAKEKQAGWRRWLGTWKSKPPRY